MTFKLEDAKNSLKKAILISPNNKLFRDEYSKVVESLRINN